MLELGDGLIAGPKGNQALGAFNRDERSQALDLLGFDRQWVFATFSTGEIFHRLTSAGDHEVVAGALAAHNRGMAEFCAEDDWLLGVGAATLDDRIPEAAISTSRGSCLRRPGSGLGRHPLQQRSGAVPLVG